MLPVQLIISSLILSRYVHREESVQLIKRATFIINAVIVLHTMFLLSCIAANVCSLYLGHADVVVVDVVCWLLRILHFMLFTIEGHVYMFKVKTARDFIRNELPCCGDKKTEEAATQEVLLE